MSKYESDYKSSIESPELFWGEQAKALNWFQEPKEILSKNESGLYRWFKGGTLNTSYLALDYHVEQGRGDQTALIYDSPVANRKKQYTYLQLRDEVAKLAGALKGLGVEKGDRVIIYMPMIPRAAIAMLACARLGAIHSVVFGGFAPHELAVRIDDAKPKVILSASGGIEITRIIPYKPLIDQAIEEAEHKPERVVVFQRDFYKAELRGPRDLDWQEIADHAEPASWTEVQATDPLYILYTSGTTGKPKGVVRDNGGHAVALKYSMSHVYDVQPGDVYWAASDVGWVVGHSYIVYGPLLHGCTTILFEGKPIKTPDPGTFWRIIEEYKVKVLFTAPTGIRAIKKEDPNGMYFEKYDTSSLKYLFLAGERCDVATYSWSKELLGVPVIDHWWQTESGWPMLANLAGYGLIEPKPGSATRPVPGFNVQVLDGDSQPAPAGQEGSVVVKLPMPPGCLPTLWQNDARFKEGYLEAFPGYYFSGDGGYIDEDGYVFITGRMDDVINVAGHRLSTADIEEIVASHESVAECAVVGFGDDLKGQVPVGFVVLKQGVTIAEEVIEKALVQMVRDKIGAIANFKKVAFVQKLPKTRSGKILRKSMRLIADGKAFPTPSTIEDPEALEFMKHLINSFNYNNLEVVLKGNTLIVSLNRSKYSNSINLAMLKDLKKLLTYINNHDDVRSVILSSLDPVYFSTGLDFQELKSLGPEGLFEFSREGQNVLKALRDCHKPIVAAVKGEVHGSALELIMACHFRVAGKRVPFAFPGAKLGLVPGLGGTQRLPIMVGKAKAIELLLSGGEFSAHEAREMGIVNHVVEDAEVLPKAEQILKGINANSPQFNASILKCINAGVDADRDGFHEESEAFRDTFLSKHFQRRLQEFEPKD